jgi:predicted nuclease of restriction endonuclease-like (RecB) superfamily
MLEAHQNLGEVLTLLYGQSAFHFYTLEVAKLLASSQNLKLKIESSLYNANRLAEQTKE